MARRHLKKVYNRQGAFARLRRSKAARVVLVLAVLLALAALVRFVLLPLFGVSFEPENQLVEQSFRDPLSGGGSQTTQSQNDLSSLQKEALIDAEFRSINDAYLSGDEIVFSSSSVVGGVAVYDKLVVYNTATNTHERIDVSLKYDNIIWTRLSGDYIVYLDSSTTGGGRIMLYDRSSHKSVVVKEYAYAVPQISVHGDLLAFWQQAGEQLDRIYLYNLRTRESAAVRVLENLPTVSGPVHLSEQGLVYSVPYMEEQLLRCRIFVQSPQDGSTVELDPGRFAYAPKANDRYVAFLSSTSGPPRDVYLMQKGTDAPTLAVKGVVNYDMGDDFFAFTKENNVYVYRFSNGQIYRLNSAVSRGRLAAVNGNTVVWYDVTGGSRDVDVVKYAKVEW